MFCLLVDPPKSVRLLCTFEISDAATDAMQPANVIRVLLPSSVSCVLVILTQCIMCLVAFFFPFSTLFPKLAISAPILLVGAVFARACRRLLGISASAPAYVGLTILFAWGVYIAVIREGIPPVTDVIMNAEFMLLMVGFYRISCSDPGVMRYLPLHSNRSDLNALSAEGMQSQRDGVSQRWSEEESENSVYLHRVRYCKICKGHIKGFDHHCPAFGNCIGQNNYLLFMVLLLGFIMVELSYVACCGQFIVRLDDAHTFAVERSIASYLPMSLMLFTLFQVLWQVIFLMWHVYCICVNIRTDEWINWKRYPEFQSVALPETGGVPPEVKFRNPYDRGILSNIKEFLSLE